jgi:hypothetical protein
MASKQFKEEETPPDISLTVEEINSLVRCVMYGEVYVVQILAKVWYQFFLLTCFMIYLSPSK